MQVQSLGQEDPLEEGMATHSSILVWKIPRSKIAGSYGNSMFNFVRNCQTVLQNDCTILYSHEQERTVPIIIPHPHQNLVLDFGRQV